MKTIILTILFALMTLGVAGQNTDNLSEKSEMEKVKESLEKVLPQFPGGHEALMKFLKKNVTYPKLAALYGVEGTVNMTFTVDKDGKLSEISAKDCQIKRFNTTKFDQETEAKQQELKREFALLFAKEGARVIRKMPKWRPGKIDGVEVRVNHSLVINFAIPDK